MSYLLWETLLLKDIIKLFYYYSFTKFLSPLLEYFLAGEILVLDTLLDTFLSDTLY